MKTLITAAAFAALAIGAAAPANAAAAGGGLGGVRAAVPTELVQVHYRPYKHHHYNKWRKHKRKQVCVYRWGKKRCWWR